jgi:hypothetical protein
MKKITNKLFPNKKQDKLTVETKLKSLVHKLDTKIKEYDGKAKICRVKAKKFLKSGNKEAARTMLVRFKAYQAKSLQYNSMIAKAERHLEALEEAGVMTDVTTAMEASTGQLKKAAASVNPEKAMEINEEAEGSIDSINEATELFAGDLETDLGVDIEDEFNQLETELMLEDAGKLPDVAEGEEETESMSVEEDGVKGTKSKDELQQEIAKLKKELDI